jgi:hypothetical protein
MNSHTVLNQLCQSKCLFKLSSFENRLRQENYSLDKLQHKCDYLSLYNIAIRYLFMHLLKQGYDIHPSRVHYVFKEYLYLNYSIEEIVKTRNNLKYKKIKPSAQVINNLYFIIDQLRPSD